MMMFVFRANEMRRSPHMARVQLLKESLLLTFCCAVCRLNLEYLLQKLLIGLLCIGFHETRKSTQAIQSELNVI